MDYLDFFIDNYKISCIMHSKSLYVENIFLYRYVVTTSELIPMRLTDSNRKLIIEILNCSESAGFKYELIRNVIKHIN